MKTNKFETLPHELIIEICSRLPTKSIGRLKCASKQWRSLLSNPQLIKAHLTFHSHNHDQERIVIISPSHSLHTITFTHNGMDAISRKLNFQQLSDNWVSVLGSCNGLILAVNGENSKYLINPATSNYHRIPNLYLGLLDCVSFYGLGYDFATDDYKVVTLSVCLNPKASNPTFVYVYSVRKGFWRRLDESLPYDRAIPEGGSGVFVNGALHWLNSTLFTIVYKSSIIIAFDLTKEKLLAVQAPPNTLNAENNVFYKLVALKGLLCMFSCTHESKIDVWMMKSYGVKESWIKFKVTGPSSSYYGLKPLRLMDYDNVLLDVDGKNFIVYNIKEDLWTDLRVDGIVSNLGSTIFMDTLVSPTFGIGNILR